MALRYNGTLLTQIRESTNNQEYVADGAGTTQEGIPDSLFLEYLNDAQDFLQAAIIAVYPQEFVAFKSIPVQVRVADYEIGDNVFINNKLLGVEYSVDGQERNYSPLPCKTLSERDNSESSHPDFYIRLASKIKLQPTPLSSTGKLRPTYYRELDDLDLRRGVIASTTLVGALPTSFVLVDDSVLSSAALALAEYICVNDKRGNVLTYAVPITYNSTTRTLAIDSDFIPATGETWPNGAYITIGQYSTTHSKLAKNCERFLKLYAQKRIHNKDQSEAQITEDEEVGRHLETILSVYSDVSEDVLEIPIIDGD